ncbi:hypothetical protein KIN20_012655 [Parelaphostrongylus tenuis]|uniref:Gamma interferon inducible lysosomal thiol reductase n=1 Tax=Parelaphostrongylus tenuis TaxID=148309 RepID=A0AAD5MV08_PARTN|nr:hypothetical protein KIN20_012655 [Parelaphostrongylus tenuis]
MLLNLLLLGLSVVSADRCTSVPPSLWCANDELSKQCGFEDLCNRYRLANHNKPINITVLMEALCPDCQLWIVGEFYPKVFKNFAEFINIELVPFGNAKITNGSITCQHGEEECRINRFESCLIDAVKSQDHYVPLIYCIEYQLQSTVPFENATAKCFRRLSVSEEVQRMIQSCMVSQIGAKLQQEAAEKTANIWPDKHTFVPWVIVNGISLKSKQTMINNLPYLLCEWYTGDKKIPFCRSEKKKGCLKMVGENFIHRCSSQVFSVRLLM